MQYNRTDQQQPGGNPSKRMGIHRNAFHDACSPDNPGKITQQDPGVPKPAPNQKPTAFVQSIKIPRVS